MVARQGGQALLALLQDEIPLHVELYLASLAGYDPGTTRHHHRFKFTLVVRHLYRPPFSRSPC